MAKIAHSPALERIYARPLDLEPRIVAEHRLQPRENVLGFLLLIRIGVPAKLEIDTPDVVGLAMQQRGLVAVKGRIEPEPALGRKFRAHVDIGDQEAIAKHLAVAVQPEHAADRAARTVGDDQPVGMYDVFAVRRGDTHRDAIWLLR